MASAARGVTPTATDGQIRLITKVARMYHERGIRQVEIAETLHLSQTRVSRLLKRAAELGIVRTVVAVAPVCTPTSRKPWKPRTGWPRRSSSTCRAATWTSPPASARPAPRTSKPR
ncbi:winged helix-turn-helix transcriptional regulator [Phytohabitans rumicis]|uniref:winged helix-turn-helix transcriptional regulator n=1 Tax=Phytohabitans rumicis TaxID=1076125 RepID=UPI001C49B211